MLLLYLLYSKFAAGLLVENPKQITTAPIRHQAAYMLKLKLLPGKMTLLPANESILSIFF